MGIIFTLSILSSALILGMIHALEVDHILAVTGFIHKEEERRESILRAFGWVLGHTTTLLIISLIVFALKIQVGLIFSHLAERVVGLILVVLGILTIKKYYFHTHEHSHDGEHPHIHSHSHLFSLKHIHRHSIVGVGLAHGFAGSGAFVALVPAAFFSSIFLVVLFVLLFGLGTLVSMLLATLFMRRYAVDEVAKMSLGILSIVFGIYLLYN